MGTIEHTIGEWTVHRNGAATHSKCGLTYPNHRTDGKHFCRAETWSGDGYMPGMVCELIKINRALSRGVDVEDL